MTREEIVAAAEGWLGTPYLHQASAKGAGADCLGLIRGLYTELLGTAPETPPPYTPDWNERRPADEPLLSAARRHLMEVSSPVCAGRSIRLPSPASGRGAGGEGPYTERSLLVDAPSPCPLPQAGEGRGPHAIAVRRGQVLIFRIAKGGPAKHCGIVSGDDRFIHAYAGRAVIESWLCRWWTERIAGVFEFPGVDAWPS